MGSNRVAHGFKPLEVVLSDTNRTDYRIPAGLIAFAAIILAAVEAAKIRLRSTVREPILSEGLAQWDKNPCTDLYYQ